MKWFPCPASPNQHELIANSSAKIKKSSLGAKMLLSATSVSTRTIQDFNPHFNLGNKLITANTPFREVLTIFDTKNLWRKTLQSSTCSSQFYMVYPRISRFIIILPFSKQPQRSFPDKVQTQVSSQVQICEIPMDSLPNSLKNAMDFPTTPSTFFPVPPSPAGAPAGLPPWPRRGNGPRPRSGAAPDWHLARGHGHGATGWHRQK